MNTPGESTENDRVEQVVWENLPVGLVLLDEEGRITRANEVAARLLTPAEGPLVGEDFFAFGEVISRVAALKRYRGEFASGDISFDFPIETSPRFGAARTQARMRSVRLPVGTCQGYAIIEDLTAFRGEQARRRRAERLASAAEATLELAHEVRNNVQSVALLTELLGEETRDPRRAELLRLVTDEARRAEALMERQLALAGERDARSMERVDLNALLGRVVKLREAGFARRGIRVRLDVDRALPLILGDSASLTQVLLNLVINAEDALESLPEEKRLILRTRTSSAGVVLAVVDNGIGMDPDTLAHVFDPFFSSKPGGSGLGLSVSRAVVADHRGRLWAESEPSRGTAFFVELPVGATRPETSGPLATAAPVRRPRSSGTAAVPRAILIADDEPVIRLAVQQILGARGHTVYAAPTVTEALRIASIFEIDVALVDYHIAGDSSRLLRKLRDMPKLRGRVVLISGDPAAARSSITNPEEVRFLSKPFCYDELVAWVEDPESEISSEA